MGLRFDYYSARLSGWKLRPRLLIFSRLWGSCSRGLYLCASDASNRLARLRRGLPGLAH
jgi:hypothetical protein